MEEQNVKTECLCAVRRRVPGARSRCSAESVLNNLDKEKYNIFPVGITKTGE